MISLMLVDQLLRTLSPGGLMRIDDEQGPVSLAPGLVVL